MEIIMSNGKVIINVCISHIAHIRGWADKYLANV